MPIQVEGLCAKQLKLLVVLAAIFYLVLDHQMSQLSDTSFTVHLATVESGLKLDLIFKSCGGNLVKYLEEPIF